MNYFVIAFLVLAVLAGTVAAAFLWSVQAFGKNAKATVATVVGMQGKWTLVSFRHDKRVVTAPAASFDGASISAGQKLPVKYLPNEKAPMKWDIRIIGKAGYGQVKIRRISFGCGAASAVFIFLAIVFGIAF